MFINMNLIFMWIGTPQAPVTAFQACRGHSFPRKWGLGIPKHIQILAILKHMSSFLINIDYYTLWVLHWALYIWRERDYIGLAIVPSWAE